jgi:hypothetical protein
MRLRISDTNLVEPLVQALNDTDCAAARAGDDSVAVFVPWAGADPQQARMEVLFFVRSWGLAHAGFDVRLA